jgi:hypothetical protein
VTNKIVTKKLSQLAQAIKKTNAFLDFFTKHLKLLKIISVAKILWQNKMPQKKCHKVVANKIATKKLPQLVWVMEKLVLETDAENSEKLF